MTGKNTYKSFNGKILRSEVFAFKPKNNYETEPPEEKLSPNLFGDVSSKNKCTRFVENAVHCTYCKF